MKVSQWSFWPYRIKLMFLEDYEGATKHQFAPEMLLAGNFRLLLKFRFCSFFLSITGFQ